VEAFAETPRLLLTNVPADFDAAELLPVFNSNPGFLASSGYSPPFTQSDVEMYLMTETQAENSQCLLIRLRDNLQIIGTAAIRVPNPKDGLPWIGLLLVEASRQRQGIGREAALAIEHRLADEAWSCVRLFALQANPDAKAFWESLDYRTTGDAQDSHGRASWLLEKSFGSGPKAQGA
jgi:RimJ/RimL family protein N-acetyltransferase